jgi:hypothetical protein
VQLTLDANRVCVQLVVAVKRVLGLLDVPHSHAGHQAGVEPAAEQDGQRRIAHQPLHNRIDEGLLHE